MSNYNVDNMSSFLGSDCTDDDASLFGAHLEEKGWTLFMGTDAPIDTWSESDGLAGDQYRAFKQENGEWREMDDQEWQTALAECFN